MARIGELDLPDRLAPAIPPIVTQIGFGLLCAGAVTTVRAAIDALAPAAGPFALGYPAVLIATLFGRWTAGAITAAVTILYSWYFTLPVFGSFNFANPADGPRLLVNALCYTLIVLVAELFRRAVRRASAERDREVADRDLFLQEFDHRVKNNFMLVTSLIELHRRRAQEPATRDALSAALVRVESIARAHRHLYRDGGFVRTVDMAEYLGELCTTLSEALFLHGTILLECSSAHAAMPRDRAVSIGLVVNELVTNAAKHAFAGRDAGTIRVDFQLAEQGGWVLTVRDDGVGMSPETLEKGRDGGLGSRLVEAFARQAGGKLATQSAADGTRVTLTLEP